MNPHPITAVPYDSKTPLWWKCPLGPDHIWQSTISSRLDKLSLLSTHSEFKEDFKGVKDCPCCLNLKGSVTNSLRTLFPGLSSQFCPVTSEEDENDWVDDASENDEEEQSKKQEKTNRKNVTPENLMKTSNVNVWFTCEIATDHKWLMPLQEAFKQISSPDDRLSCPCCAGLKVCASNCLENVRPDLAGMWSFEKNVEAGLKDGPGGVLAKSEGIFWVENGEGRVWEVNVREAVGTPGLPIPPPLPVPPPAPKPEVEKEKITEVPAPTPAPISAPAPAPLLSPSSPEEDKKWKQKFTKTINALKFASGFKAIMGLGFGKKKKKPAEIKFKSGDEGEEKGGAEIKNNKPSILT